MDLPSQIETSMSGSRAEMICSFVVILVGLRRLPTEAAAEGRSRSGEPGKIPEELRSSLQMEDANAARDPCDLSVAQDRNLR
jgi:hypothetical protein